MTRARTGAKSSSGANDGPRGTMRAITTDGKSARLEKTHAAPALETGTAIVRPRLIAVGRTDVEVSRGMHGFSGVLGHAFVGDVEAVAAGGPEKLVGTRVVASIGSCCRACDMCQSGLSQHCRERTLLGIDGRNGCLADCVRVPVNDLVPVPDDVDDDHAVFALPVAAALQAIRQLTLEGKPYITVLGDGPLGLIAVQLMSQLNASVRLVGRYSEKLAICEKWNIKHRHVDDVGRRADQDVVVDCTGSPAGFMIATKLVRPRGTIVLKSVGAPERLAGCEPDLTPIVMRELTVIGSFLGPLSEALRCLSRREVDVVSLISRRMRLDDGPAILQAAADPGALAVLVTP